VDCLKDSSLLLVPSHFVSSMPLPEPSCSASRSDNTTATNCNCISINSNYQWTFISVPLGRKLWWCSYFRQWTCTWVCCDKKLLWLGQQYLDIRLQHVEGGIVQRINKAQQQWDWRFHFENTHLSMCVRILWCRLVKAISQSGAMPTGYRVHTRKMLPNQFNNEW
jgi:hypothetical protein